MRALILVSALALATPAWAANDADVELERYKVCVQVSHDYERCYLEHSPEEEALRVAQGLLATCDGLNAKGTPAAWCPAIRAYIKQRWGN